MISATQPRGATGWALLIFALILAFLGLVLAAGGLWLVALGGSWYYLIAGLGLILSGVLMAKDSLTGVWLYLAVFAGTVIWAVWEVGLSPWELLPRVFGYIVLGVIVLLLLPTLKRRQATT
ncbi:hypothetical protein [Modicisalibacter luteus]|uniref:Glucose dehydrogenase n=1 Tax=Modicisalibacter luteus TaxID=453962 RepID=A0ABV7M0U8_9GAMM|nr:hypothetical protein [Halomonas lutea]GHA93288.1 hypothetical protein GCM10007159_13630 [Halomonas lutea]